MTSQNGKTSSLIEEMGLETPGKKWRAQGRPIKNYIKEAWTSKTWTPFLYSKLVVIMPSSVVIKIICTFFWAGRGINLESQM